MLSSKQLCKFIVVFFLFSSSWGVAQEVVGDLSADFRTGSLPENWSYLWNAHGKIGNAESYEPLIPMDASAKGPWTVDGAIPSKTRGAGYLQLRLGTNRTYLLAHPGRGGGAEGISSSKYLIMAFSVPKSGNYRIGNGEITLTHEESDGLDYFVYVNDTQKFSGIVKPKEIESLSGDLGALSAGDKVYVCVGPNKNDGYDEFRIHYQITVSP